MRPNIGVSVTRFCAPGQLGSIYDSANERGSPSENGYCETFNSKLVTNCSSTLAPHASGVHEQRKRGFVEELDQRRAPSVDQYFTFNLDRNIEWEFRDADRRPGVLASFLPENF
jgi:hypothetical protein